VQGTIASSATGTLSNTASLTPPAGFTNTDADAGPGGAASATDTDSLSLDAEVTLSKSVTTTSPIFGSHDAFTLTAKNTGPSDAGQVVVTDPVPAGLALVSETPSAGTVAVSGQTVTWTIPDLAAEATDTVIITVAVDTGEVANQASYSAAAPNAAGKTTGVSNPVTLDACGISTPLVPYLFAGTSRTGNILGLFCVNGVGTGTYTQIGGGKGTGTVTSSGGSTHVTAFGTAMALLGQVGAHASTYSETAPKISAGTFSLTKTLTS